MSGAGKESFRGAACEGGLVWEERHGLGVGVGFSYWLIAAIASFRFMSSV